jgi:subtilisin
VAARRGVGLRILLRLVVGGLCLVAVLAGSTSSLASGTSATGVIPGQYIVVLKGGADRAAAVASARSLGGDVSFQYRHALNGFAVRLSDAAVVVIKSRRDVLFVAPDREFAAVAAPTTPCTDLTQCQRISNGVNRIDGDLSSTRSGDGKGSVNVNVAVIDSGTGPHPDLNVVGGVDCTRKGDGTYNDLQGHGTLTGGFIGALDNDFGRVGVAPGARLWAVRVLSPQGFHATGTDAEIICGIDWVTSTRTDADPANDIPVANMSIGGPDPKLKGDDGNCGLTNGDAMHLAICNSVAAGVTYVVSAGNEGKDLKDFFPAAYDEVLTATAMGDWDGQPGALAPAGSVFCGAGDPPDQPDDVFAWFSNFATLAADQSHTLAGPGVCIGSTYLNNGYATASGTSFASPLIAGTIALCLTSGKKPCAGLAPSQIIKKMIGDAAAFNTSNSGYGFQGDPLRPTSGNYYGYLIRAGLY